MKNIWQALFFVLLGAIILLESGVFAKDEGDIVPGAMRFIQHFDRNGDGLVSEDEFPGPADHFDELDINADGYIDPTEAPKGPPPCPGKDGAGFVQCFDRNGDGLVSEDEFPGPADHFDELDINADGYIDPSEAPKGPPPHPPHHMMERNKN